MSDAPGGTGILAVTSRWKARSSWTVFRILEGVPDRVLDVRKCLFCRYTPLPRVELDLLGQPGSALEAILEADQGPVGVFGFDAAHGRRDDFAFELLDPDAALVDGVPPVDGIDGGPL